MYDFSNSVRSSFSSGLNTYICIDWTIALFASDIFHVHIFRSHLTFYDFSLEIRLPDILFFIFTNWILIDGFFPLPLSLTLSRSLSAQNTNDAMNIVLRIESASQLRMWTSHEHKRNEKYRLMYDEFQWIYETIKTSFRFLNDEYAKIMIIIMIIITISTMENEI